MTSKEPRQRGSPIFIHTAAKPRSDQVTRDPVTWSHCNRVTYALTEDGYEAGNRDWELKLLH